VRATFADRYDPVRLSSTAELLNAIAHAKSVTLGAYVIHRGNPLLGALERAAARGADVHVRLATPYRDANGAITRGNDAVVRELRDHGVDAVRSPSLAHAKAAIVDGRVYLDDRNWSSGRRDTIVVDSIAADVASMKQAIDGEVPAPRTAFAAMKSDALRLERDTITSSRGPLDVETEVIGSSPVSKALRLAAKHGSVRLIVSNAELQHDPRERKTLRKLAAAGVQIRVGNSRSGVGNEKFCISGDEAWVGSANATWCGHGAGLSDWGLRTNGRDITAALHQRFDDNWNRSQAFVV